MTNAQQEDVVNQINDLAVETTQTLVDAAYLAQRQSAELIQAWLNTLGANQKQQRDIATKIVRQAQEAQTLLQQYVQESLRANTEAFSQATRAGANTVAENVNRANQQARAATNAK